MFSKPSRSCTFSCRIKYVTCLLLYSLAHPLVYSVPWWPAVCAGTVSSAGLRLPHSSFPTRLFQILSSINCWTATRLSWALGSQAPFCSWEGSTDRSPSCICMIPKVWITPNDELASVVTLVSPYMYLIMSIMLYHMLVIIFYCMPILHFSIA